MATTSPPLALIILYVGTQVVLGHNSILTVILIFDDAFD